MTHIDAVAPVFHLSLGLIWRQVLESAYNIVRLFMGSADESILARVLDNVATIHGWSQRCAMRLWASERCQLRRGSCVALSVSQPHGPF
jgi:hypothetical protein